MGEMEKFFDFELDWGSPESKVSMWRAMHRYGGTILVVDQQKKGKENSDSGLDDGDIVDRGSLIKKNQTK